MLLKENNASKLNAIIINNSQNSDNDQISDKLIGAYILKQRAQMREINKATTAKPEYFPKKYLDRGTGRESINSKPLSLNSRIMLVITNKPIVKTQNKRSENASVAACI